MGFTALFQDFRDPDAKAKPHYMGLWYLEKMAPQATINWLKMAGNQILMLSSISGELVG